MTKEEKMWVRGALRKWAHNLSVLNPYPQSTTVYRAMREGGQVESSHFGPSIPNGVCLTWAEAEAVDRALCELHVDYPAPITAVRYFYTMPTARALEKFGFSRRKFFYDKSIGEEKIVDYFRVT